MRSSCSRMYGTCAAASGVLTVMRTSSDPASASSLTWIAVPIASTVSVLVIDWTRTGASPPIVTIRGPQVTLAWRDRRAFGAAASIGRQPRLLALSVMMSRSRFDFEPCHATGARKRCEVERLAPDLHLDACRAADDHRQR